MVRIIAWNISNKNAQNQYFRHLLKSGEGASIAFDTIQECWVTYDQEFAEQKQKEGFEVTSRAIVNE
jgi:hypothetical protein